MTTISTKVGKYTVNDGSGVIPEATDGTVSLTMKQALGYERRAVRIVFSDAAEIHAAEMRFARKALALRQVELGKLLGVNACTVSDWESGKCRITRQTQLAMRSLLEQAERGPAWPPEAWAIEALETNRSRKSDPPSTFVVEAPPRSKRSRAA
jgi:DNA-binding transcriptional regulator YiaG